MKALLEALEEADKLIEAVGTTVPKGYIILKETEKKNEDGSNLELYVSDMALMCSRNWYEIDTVLFPVTMNSIHICMNNTSPDPSKNMTLLMLRLISSSPK